MPATRAIALLLPAALLLAGGAAHAAEQKVTVSGMAAIVGGDVPAARDGAIADARLKAVERVAGANVTSRTTYHAELYESGTLRIDVQGVVVGYEVKREWQDDVGLYHVEAEIVVDDDPLVDELIRLVRADRVIVVAHEPDPDSVGQPVLEAELAEALDQIGYRHVVAIEAIADERSLALAKQARDGDLAAARSLGVYFLADAVVFGTLDARVGQSMSDTVHTAQADGSARAFRTADGNVIAEVNVDGTRGFGRTPVAAARDAKNKTAALLAEGLQQRLTPQPEREIDVVFYDIPDMAGYRRIRALLEELRWVNGVRPDPLGYHPTKSVLKVRYAEEPTVLGGALDRRPDLETISAGEDGIEVRVIGEAGH